MLDILSASQRLKNKLQLLHVRFDEWLEALNYSPKTRVNYVRDVRVFLDWLIENISIQSIADVSPAHLQQYQIAIFNYERTDEKNAGKRLSVGTQSNRLAALRKFFAWLLNEQQIASNPATSLHLPRQSKRLPRNVLSKGEAKRLIEATPTKKPRDARDRAILEVLYGTGIRRAELITLTIYDVDFDAATLRVQGKGDATRLVPLTDSAMAALKLYMDEARPVFAREASQTRLFVSSRSGGPLDDADIVRIVQKAAKCAGIKKHITPHTLRHTFATHLLKGKADIRQIQKLLGHRRLSSTEIYTHVELGDLHEVVARCHPREKGSFKPDK